MITEFVGIIFGMIAIIIFATLFFIHWAIILPVLAVFLLFYSIKKWQKYNTEKQYSHLITNYQNGGIFPKGVAEDNNEILSFKSNRK